MLLLLSLFSAFNAISQTSNVGIGTTTPSSRLSVNGSLSVAYRSVTAPAYSLTDADYFVVYNGTVGATFTLPGAVTGDGNLSGRVYKVRNNASAPLVLKPFSSENISDQRAVYLDSGATAEVINTGATSGTTWELSTTIGQPVRDNIRFSLYNSGCASCAAYDAAAVNSWVRITTAEYNNLFTDISGITAYAAPSAQVASASGIGTNGPVTVSQSSAASTVPGDSYPIAFAFRTNAPTLTSTASFKLKISTTSITAGYSDFPAGTVASLASGSNSPLNFFIMKKPSFTTPSGLNSYLALYSSINIGLYRAGSGNSYSATGDASTMTFGNQTAQFQVLATPNKQW